MMRLTLIPAALLLLLFLLLSSSHVLSFVLKSTSQIISSPHLLNMVIRGLIAAVPFLVIPTAIVLWVLQSMHSSVGVDKPTPNQLQNEDQNACALFRHVPQLKDRLAFRQLGDFPTPVHRGICSARPIENQEEIARRVQFYVKREDLTSAKYGGNKVRTLQHQLAVIEAKFERGGSQREVFVFGSGGSNQVVATVVHALAHKLPAVTPLWIADPSDLDNTLNMLSTLSFPLERSETWGKPIPLLVALITALVRNNSFILPLGGNNPSGVLGQVGGMLELAEQIDAGDLPDCDGIYVAVGSACTASGMIIGVALARKLGLGAFAKSGFLLHLVPIHHGFSFLSRTTGIYKSAFSRYIPLTIRHSIHATCKELTSLGGPDILKEALAVLKDEIIVHDDARLTGEYGIHSEPSRACARLFDASNKITTIDERKEAPGLWLCGHFTAKAMTAMCDDLLKEENAGKNMVFWQTKSRVQPRGNLDEWERMQQMPPKVQTWANQGLPQSDDRPGKVDLKFGSVKDYRGLMTDIFRE